MPFVKLVVLQPGRSAREFEMIGDLVTIGRALDNTIPLEGDTDVSRYHAEIVRRVDGFWVSDLGSSNGTTVNDRGVELEHQLQNGDLISTGGSTVIEFQLSESPWPRKHKETPPDPDEVSSLESSSATNYEAPLVHVPPPPSQLPVVSGSTGGPSLGLILAGVGGGLLLVALVGVVIFVKFSSRCSPTARIISPRTGATIREPTPIRVEVDNQECIDRVIYQLDGQKLASSEAAPYDVMLNPDSIPGLGDGNHILSVTVEDLEGNRNSQSETVLVAFDTGVGVKKEEEASAPDAGNPKPGGADSRTAIDVSEVRNMVSKFAQRINVKSDYIFDPEFLQVVQGRTAQYANSITLRRAHSYREVINEAFVGENGLAASLGYVTALSRSRFVVATGRNATAVSGADADEPQGLWRIQPSLAKAAGYLGRCQSGATLGDPDQKCAAIVASVYTKALVVDLFRGEFVYAVSTFGMPFKDAAQFRDQLPPDSRDFWKVIKSGPQRERVVSFFAAGIVGENPQKFGLSANESLTSLY